MAWIEHCLWWGSIEIAVLALLLGLTAWSCGRRRPRLAALLWLIVPLKAIVTFVPGTAFRIDQLLPGAWSAGVSALAPAPASIAASAAAGARHDKWSEKTTSAGGTAYASDHGPARPGSLLVIVWLGGAVVLLGLHLVRVGQILLLVRTRPPLPPGVATVLADEAARCGLSRPPTLVVSQHLSSPAVLGGVRATVLVPAWLATAPRDTCLRWVLRHELTHVRHRDHWALLIQTIAGILFWFHPFLWWARRHWRRNMERACDDGVAAQPAEAREYAATLIAVMEQLLAGTHRLRGAPALFATRTEAGDRIRRLLDRKRQIPRPLGTIGVAFWIAITLAATALSLRPPLARAAEQPRARASLKVDLGPDNQRVEAGWSRWSGDRNQNFSTPFDHDFEVEIDRDHAWRDRGDDNDSDDDRDEDQDDSPAATIALEFMLRDGLRERDDRDVRLTFRRLDRGDYVLELFSCDIGENRRAAVGHFDVEIDGVVVLENQATMGRASLASAALPPLTLTSHGEPVLVKFVRREGDVWLNGFILSGPARDDRN